MANVRQRRSDYPDHIRDYARQLWRTGLTLEQVATRLEDERESYGLDKGPHVNTVKGWMRGETRDGSSPWRLELSSAEDAALCASVIEYASELSPGGWLTAREAFWCARIRRLVPNLAAFETYRLAGRFVAAENDSDKSVLRELELLVLTNPWDPTTGARGMYLDRVGRGTIRGEWFAPGAAGRGPKEDVWAQTQRVASVLNQARKDGKR